MMFSHFLKCFNRISTIALCSLLCITEVSAQITTDGTVGAATRLSAPDYVISADLGQQQGSNLFHSFSEFSVQSNETATFTGDSSISNVISRVTGNQVSNIDGAIRSEIPNADLYLINPNGVVLGKNASLEVQGSFHLSTADTVKLEDGGEFNAKTPQTSVLSSAPVKAFGFLTDSPKAIQANGTKLVVPENKTLSLVGGDMQLTDATLSTRKGQMQVVSVAGKGEVSWSTDGVNSTAAGGTVQLSNTIVRASNPSEGAGAGAVYIRGGKIEMDKGSAFTSLVTTENGGDIVVQADNLNLKGGSNISTTTAGVGHTGTIKVEVTNDLTVDGETATTATSSIQNTAARGSTGNTGNVQIQAKTLNVVQGAAIQNNTSGTGNGGKISVKTGQLNISGENKLGLSRIVADIPATSQKTSGTGGSIEVEATSVNLSKGGQIAANSRGAAGNGGNVKITANTVHLSGTATAIASSGILSPTTISTLTAQNGNAGNVEIQADTLTLQDGANLTSSTTGAGNAGQITVKAGNLTVAGKSSQQKASQISADSLSTASNAGMGGYIDIQAQQVQLSQAGQVTAATNGNGAGGTIVIQAGNLTLYQGGTINTSTRGTGQGGNVQVKLTGDLVINGVSETGNSSVIASETYATSENAGQGGTIQIAANNALLQEGGQISAVTYGQGQGGNIEVDLQNRAVFSGKNGSYQSGIILSSTKEYSQATAGNSSLSAKRVTLTDGAKIATDTVLANGGDIQLKIEGILIVQDSDITTSVGGGQGSGGNIHLDSRFVVQKNGAIIARAKRGEGGNISIKAVGNYQLYPVTSSPISASSELGKSGSVDISTPDVDLTGSLIVLPAEYSGDEEQLASRCDAKRADKMSSFIISQREGVAHTQGDLLGNNAVNAASDAQHLTLTIPTGTVFKLNKCE